MVDQLDRLYQALVRRVRDVRPENLTRSFEVSEILRTFIPYRATRADVGVETAEDYEVLLLRLLSGERGYVFTDDAMQDDLRRELDSGNPDLRALHAYGTAKATFAQHAMRLVLESTPAPSPAPSSTPETEPAAAAQAALRDTEGRAAAAFERTASARAPQMSDVSTALESLQRQLPPTPPPLSDALAPDAKARTSFQARGSQIPDPTADSMQRTPRPGCRFCGQLLPAGRDVTFCPHCGQNLKVRRCSGCSAEMDPAWKFCVTCGRAAG
jgi:hypothetical protein